MFTTPIVAFFYIGKDMLYYVVVTPRVVNLLMNVSCNGILHCATKIDIKILFCKSKTK